MAKKLPPKDAVIIGLGWTGSILAHELCDAGLSVAAIERGPWRDPTAEFTPTMAQDELRFRIRHDLFLRPSQTSVMFRNNAGQTALPVRTWGAFMLGNGVAADCTGMPKRGAFCRVISSASLTLPSAMAQSFSPRT
jgi:gluconate 2-dehydrogenase alpha chain